MWSIFMESLGKMAGVGALGAFGVVGVVGVKSNPKSGLKEQVHMLRNI